MSFNFLENLGKSIQKTIEKQNERKNINVSEIEGIENEEIELANKLDAIEEYTIDRFEENMAVLEDRKTGRMKPSGHLEPLLGPYTWPFLQQS